MLLRFSAIGSQLSIHSIGFTEIAKFKTFSEIVKFKNFTEIVKF